MAERRVVLDDGASTILQSWGDRGPVVLAVHGMTSSRRSWERLAAHLAGRYRVYAYDQRGHGDSHAVSGPMTLARGVRDAENVARAIGEPIDLLIGHSWGGAVAIQAGATTSGGAGIRVRTVAAIDPMLRQAGAQWYAEFLEDLHEVFAFQGAAREARIRESYAAWSPLDVEGKVHAVHAMTTAPIEGLQTENPPESWNLIATIAGYEKPLWLAMAQPEESINDAATQAELARTHAPSVEIITLEGGHNLHRTTFEPFAAALDAFLTSIVTQAP